MIKTQFVLVGFSSYLLLLSLVFSEVPSVGSWSFADCSNNFIRNNESPTVNSTVSALVARCVNFTNSSLPIYSGIISAVCESWADVERQCHQLSGNFSLKTCREGAKECTIIPKFFITRICQISTAVSLNQQILCRRWSQSQTNMAFVVGNVCSVCLAVDSTASGDAVDNGLTRDTSDDYTPSSPPSSDSTDDSLPEPIDFEQPTPLADVADDSRMFCEDTFKETLNFAIDVADYFCPVSVNNPNWLNITCSSKSFITDWVNGYPVLFASIQSAICKMNSIGSLPERCSVAGLIAKTSANSVAHFTCQLLNSTGEEQPASLKMVTLTTPTPTTTTKPSTTQALLRTIKNEFVPGQYCVIPTFDQAVYDWVSFECDSGQKKCRKNGNIQLSCKLGYSLIGQTNLTCVNSGQGVSWDSPLLPRCAACKMPPPPEHGAYGWISSGCNSTAGVCGKNWYVQYTCEAGYSPIGQSRISCIGNFELEWDRLPPKCGGCDIPPVPDRAVLDWLSIGCNATAGKCGRGWELQYGCKLGYTPSGPTRISCVDKNSTALGWNYMPPQCLGCKWQPPSLQGFYQTTSPNCNNVDLSCGRDFYVEYGCFPGYSPIGPVRTTCLARNNDSFQLAWDRPAPGCIGCDLRDPPEHGSFDYLSNGCSVAQKKCAADGASFVQYACHLGYSPNGPDRSFCRATSATTTAWDNPVPKCISCTIPDAPAHGSVAITLGCDLPEKKCSRDWFIQFDCDPGFRLNGPGKLTCKGNLTLNWDASPPQCISNK